MTGKHRKQDNELEELRKEILALKGALAAIQPDHPLLQHNRQ